MDLNLTKVLETYIYSHEMDYHGYYPPSLMFRTLNGGFYRVMGMNGLRMVDIRDKINATHMVGMLDMLIEKDISVLGDSRHTAELYAPPMSRTKGVFSNRVYLLKDGEQIAMLDGVAMVVDLATRKVIPTLDVLERMERPVFPAEAPVPQRLQMPEDMELKREYVVDYCECDVNHHMNSTRYIEKICEVLGFWKGTRKRMTRLKLEFARECVPYDTLRVYVKEAEGGYYVKGMKQTGDIAFKAFCQMAEVDHE